MMLIFSFFADSLFSQKDFYRAASEYMRLASAGLIHPAQGYLRAGECYFLSRRYRRAQDFFSLALLYAEDSLTEKEAQEKLCLSLILSKKYEEALIASTGKLKEYLEEYFNPSGEKTAVFLSAIIPGSGAILEGEVIKGVISFAVNAYFAYSTYEAWKDRNNIMFFLNVSSFLRYYFGNLRFTRSVVRKKKEKKLLEKVRAYITSQVEQNF